MMRTSVRRQISKCSGVFKAAVVAYVLGWQLLLTPLPADANDSIGSIAVGGITFLKSEDIRLIMEDLYIGSDDVRVRYKFINESPGDIRTTVLFPMPPYGWNSGEYMGAANEGPLEGFSVKVDGRIVPTRLDRRAIIGEQEVTGKLRSIGLTNDQIFKTFAACPPEDQGDFCGVTELQKRQLKKLGAWKVSETANWEQDFPSHKEIEVLHAYPPFTGKYYIYAYQQNSFDYSELEKASDACLDASTIGAIRRRVQKLVDKGASTVRIYVKTVAYILGTGRNWKGPIGSFDLTVAKDNPEQIVSLCFPGKAARISPTLIRFHQTNYLPQDSVTIYFFNIDQDQ